MTTTKHPAKRSQTPRDALPIVTVTRPRCPRCGSPWLATKRSVRDGDGVATRDTTCRHCGQRFFVIAE